MSIGRFFKSATSCGLLLAQAAGVQAAPYPLAQEPRNRALREPPPNVVVSVDNSVSMEWSSQASDGSVDPPSGVPSRMAALQSALRDGFSEAQIPDGRIRLAWQAMNNNNSPISCAGFFGDDAAGEYRAGKCTINKRPNANLMRLLDGTHRANFMRWVDGLRPGGGTPLHAMMTRAGEYMKTEGTHSPYSDDPGVANATQSSCRRSFHIFMTDGEYTLFGFNKDPANLKVPNIGNADGTPRQLPDGVEYVPLAPFTDTAGAVNDPKKWDTDSGGRWRPNQEYRPTLADMAFHYWASDLQPGIPDNVNRLKKAAAQPGPVRIGKALVPEYWNPRNDPATWQHLITHFVGFGSASSWPGAPAISTTAARPTYSGNYPELVDGTIAWPDPLVRTLPSGGYGLAWQEATGGFGFEHVPRTEDKTVPIRMDLWHAALNSRGTFTPAANAEALGNAFKSILTEIGSGTNVPLTSIAASASKVSTDTVVYRAGYDTLDWSGTLTAASFKNGSELESERLWSAHELLDERMESLGAHDIDRQVLSFAGGSADAGTTTVGKGVPFRWADLDDAWKAALQGNTDTDAESVARGQAVLDYLRGDRRNEGRGRDFRKRGHVLGDIVDSAVWYAGQPRSGFVHDGYAAFAAISRASMVYVGANDGMLHAFDAGTGKETFAYVPAGLYGTAAEPLLARLTEPSYTHRYYVDGSPFVADVYLGSASAGASAAAKAAGWKSLLVGTLGAGGKGYFVLDVTKPQDISEKNAAEVALIDTTALADDDLGHQFQSPVIDSISRRAVQVAPLNDGRKALILGNGYNSRSEKAMLWVQYLDGGKEILRIPAPVAQEVGKGNGLSAPRPVDGDGNGTVDYVYAGDLLGNLWKFDLRDTRSANWKASLGDGLDNRPLFAAGTAQPITAAPVVVDHPRGGQMVVFGTGRLFAAGDENTTDSQYLYGVWDRAGVAGTVPLSDLVEQAVDAQAVTQGKTVLRAMSNKKSVTFGGPAGKAGWYLQLPEAKERLIYPADMLSNSVGLFSTTIPGTLSDEVECMPGIGDDGWSMLIDFFEGVVPEGIAYADFAGTGIYLGFRNGSGRDDVAFRTLKPNEEVICGAAGECLPVKRPDAFRRFGWRDLFSAP